MSDINSMTYCQYVNKHSCSLQSAGLLCELAENEFNNPQSIHLPSSIFQISMVDPDVGCGELTIRIPAEVQPVIAELRPFKISIEFAVEEPQGREILFVSYSSIFVFPYFLRSLLAQFDIYLRFL